MLLILTHLPHVSMKYSYLFLLSRKTVSTTYPSVIILVFLISKFLCVAKINIHPKRKCWIKLFFSIEIFFVSSELSGSSRIHIVAFEIKTRHRATFLIWPAESIWQGVSAKWEILYFFNAVPIVFLYGFLFNNKVAQKVKFSSTVRVALTPFLCPE